MPTVEAYCVKCKFTSEMVKPVVKKTKNGRNMMTGTCVKCGTKMCKFIKN